jgi:hypothetical protein
MFTTGESCKGEKPGLFQVRSLLLARGRSGSDAGAWTVACHQVEERAHSKL